MPDLFSLRAAALSEFRSHGLRAALLLGACLAVAGAPARADSLVESFAGGLSTVHWTLYPEVSSIAVSAGELLLTQGAGAGPGLAFNPTMLGDFDARIDYRLVSWGFNNQARLGLGVQPPAGGSPWLAMERLSDDGFVSGNEGYLTHFTQVGLISSQPTTDRSGSLRVQRVGNTLTGSYWNGSAWSVVGSDTRDGYAGPQTLYLALWWEGAPPVGTQVALDNFRVDAPGTTIPAVPEPGPAGLWSVGALLLGALSRRRAARRPMSR